MNHFKVITKAPPSYIRNMNCFIWKADTSENFWIQTLIWSLSKSMLAPKPQTWEKWCLVPQAQFPGFWGFLKLSRRFYKNACKVAQLGRKTFSSNVIWVWHSSTQAYYLILDYLIETTSFWLPYYGSFIEVLSLRLPHWVTNAARQGGRIKFAFHHWGILM